ADGTRTAGKRRRGATFSALDRLRKSAGQRLLRFGGNARAETRPETDQNRERRKGAPLNIRARREWRRLHCAGSRLETGRTRIRAKRSRAITQKRRVRST